MADGQQFEHFAPRHLGLAVGQAFAPERAELKFIPQAAGQPAIAEGARMLEGQLGEFDLEAVELVGRQRAIGGEETDLFGELGGFVERVETRAPSGCLRIIELA